MSVTDKELSQLQSDLYQSGTDVSMAEVENVFHTLVTVILVIGVVLAAGWITLVILAYRRRNWARILLTVLAAIWLLLSIPSVVGTLYVGVVTAALTVVEVLLLIATLITLYVRDANQYFARLPGAEHPHPPQG